MTLDPVATDPSTGSTPEVHTPTFAVVAGGGTAGHVLPALAVGRALVQRGHPPQSIHYVGSRRGIEARLVPAAGFELTLLPGRGIERRLSRANLEAVPGLAAAVGRSVRLVARRRPAVVLSVGGGTGLELGREGEEIRRRQIARQQEILQTLMPSLPSRPVEESWTTYGPDGSATSTTIR